MYKVKLTEKEAKAVGGRRRRKRLGKRWGVGAGLSILLGFGFIFSQLVGVPEWVSIWGTGLSAAAFGFFYFWPEVIVFKAGKAFVRVWKKSTDGVVELEEGEAQEVGAIRWERGRFPRFMLKVLGMTGVAIGAPLLTNSLGVKDWISCLLFCALIAPVFYFAFRWIRLRERAGKEFVQALKEGRQP